jgi:hypothetical protein
LGWGSIGRAWAPGVARGGFDFALDDRDVGIAAAACELVVNKATQQGSPVLRPAASA